MIRNLYKSAKNVDSKPSPYIKRTSFYDHPEKHSNEVSIILVITDESLKLEELVKNKRKKYLDTSYSSKPRTSEYQDRLNYFNLICSRNESDIQNLDDAEKIKKNLFKNLHHSKLKKFKKEELDKEIVNRHQRSKKLPKEHNIYGPIQYIPTSYSRPPLPPFYRDKHWAHTAKELRQGDADQNVLTRFLYSKYDFEHSTPNCSSESERSSDSEPLRRDDSLELKPAYSAKSFSLHERIQVGDRPDKNLEIKNKYFRINENELSMSSRSSSSCSELPEDTSEVSSGFEFPIARQNRIIFYESNNQNGDYAEDVKYEANLPKLPDQGSMLAMSKRFEFDNHSKNLGLKYVRKKDTGNGLKNFNQSEVKNLSVIAEEENLSSSSNSLDSNNEEGTKNETVNDLNQNFEESSIQKDIDLASESFSSTVSSVQNSDDQHPNENFDQPQLFHIRNENFYRNSREKEDISFESLYNNYLTLIDKRFTMEIPRHKKDNKENFFYI
ncbi:hypothetical protein BpHYR1_052666 [Brachionus plicatilis]|uniref:Uncharacterized protein n=1 Tax=Brachionus plicatilis TaxID=10195 RepID=A0A3M7QEL2_BRAPC|nr:hypothetical protein BpHYR1_052666 [Brachionus plicatilis]